MIHEYAIDPESVISSWLNANILGRVVISKKTLGIGTPRMMADFPNLKNLVKTISQGHPFIG